MIREWLRPALGLAFVVLLPQLPSALGMLVFVLALLAYLVARVLVLAEPEARRFLAAHPLPLWLHLGEATFVTLALVMGLIMAAGLGLQIGIGAGVVIAVVYLIFHGVGLLMAEGLLGADEQPAKPKLRRFITAATFVAEEAVLLAAMLTTEGARVSMARAPWQLSSTLSLPLTGIAVLLLCYVPIQRISRAADDPDRSPIDAIVVQIAALHVYALTGTLPI